MISELETLLNLKAVLKLFTVSNMNIKTTLTQKKLTGFRTAK